MSLSQEEAFPRLSTAELAVLKPLATATSGEAMSAVQGGLAVNGTLLVIGAADAMQVSPLLLLSGCSHKSPIERENSTPKIRPNFTTVNTNPA